jgi:Na+:H+ antiporter, NhaA family
MTRPRQLILEHFFVVPAGVILAVAWANSAADTYFRTAQMLAFAVNDIGMALALAYLTQEILEATLPGGTLHPWRRAILPIAAGVGGVLGATGVYAAYILSGDSHILLQGWPIASAVDFGVSYLLGIIVFGRGAAFNFLLLLTITTDVIGLVLVSYQSAVSGTHPAAAALVIPAIWSAARLRRKRVRSVWPYVLVSGTLSWFGFYLGGVHPALALLPIVPFLPHTPRHLVLPAGPELRRHRSAAHFEYVFRYPVQAIGFLLALVNAGVLLKGFDAGTWAVLLAGIAGRPSGILIAIGLATSVGLRPPRRISWRDLIVLAFAASPGFTFALFLATAAFPVGPLLMQTKIGALSTVGGAVVAIAAARHLHVGRFAVDRPLVRPRRVSTPRNTQ